MISLWYRFGIDEALAANLKGLLAFNEKQEVRAL